MRLGAWHYLRAMAFDGNKARRRREALGLSRSALARQLNVREDRLGRLERGEADPRSAELLALAKHLGVSADYLLGVSDEPVA
jgi:transcriptional regulator with XRE-family HTH domain